MSKFPIQLLLTKTEQSHSHVIHIKERRRNKSIKNNHLITERFTRVVLVKTLFSCGYFFITYRLPIASKTQTTEPKSDIHVRKLLIWITKYIQDGHYNKGVEDAFFSIRMKDKTKHKNNRHLLPANYSSARQSSVLELSF